VTHETAEKWAEIVTAILLALATLATAWAGYQSSRWHGKQAEAAGATNALRAEGTRAAGEANRNAQIDVATFTQWIDARAQGDEELAAFYRQRFRKEFQPAFNAWLAQKPFTNPDAALTPFAVPEYTLAAQQEEARLDAAAEASADAMRADIERADRYVLAVVLFAAALFFAGISTRLKGHTRLWILVLGCALFTGTAVWLASFPVTVSV
jgi:hypothetical protein